MKRALALLSLLLLPLGAACSDTPPDEGSSERGEADVALPPTIDAEVAEERDAELVPPIEALPGVSVHMALDGDFGDQGSFYDHPWPSDLRLNARGGPAFGGIPRPEDIELIEGVLEIADDRPYFPTIPVAWFRFDGAVKASDGSSPTPTSGEARVQLIDVDPGSPLRGTRYPTMVRTLEPDPYVPDNLLAVAPWPGVVLPAGRRYAVVILRDYGDAAGEALGVPLALRKLAAGVRPEGELGEAALTLFNDLWGTWSELGGEADDIAAATLFSVGDVVADLFTLTEAVREEHDAAIEDLVLDPDNYGRFCVLRGALRVPTFQAGTPPYNSEGRFHFDEAGALIAQGEVSFPLVITLPKTPMPEGGYPLVLYFHGSGGVSSQVIDRGAVLEPGGTPVPGEGPAHVLAEHGFATAASALPVNPERVEGASAFEYLNFENLAAFRDTFRQGVIEQRLLLDALLDLHITPAALTGCSGPSRGDGADTYHFSSKPVFAMGQSMGGMYTNMVGAVEPRLEALVPTGAGGFWTWFILETELLNAPPLLKLVLGTDVELSFLHPILHLLESVWETADPMVFMPRLSRDPLEGHPSRDVYQPVGLDDSYFPYQLFDAVSLAYGHEQAGELVWPSMQEVLALGEREGIIDYPVSANLEGPEGAAYTGVVVQYLGDGIYDPHSIFAQLDAVKYQYGCFFKTALDSGRGVVPEPLPLGTVCPTVMP